MGLNKLEGIMETKMSMGHKLLVVATIAAVFTPAAGGIVTAIPAARCYMI